MSTGTIYVIDSVAIVADETLSVEALAAATTPRSVRLVSDVAFYFAIGAEATDESVYVPANNEIRVSLPAGLALNVIGVAAVTVSVIVFSPSS